MSAKILVVNGNVNALREDANLLERAGYEVARALDAHDALLKARHLQPELALLEMDLPGMGGAEVCRRLRARSGLAILFYSARHEAEDAAQGLDLGADDYIRRPCAAEELLARVRAALRRTPLGGPDVSGEQHFNGGELRVNFRRRELWLRGAPCALTPIEFDLLAVLLRNAGRVVPRAQLVTEVWGDNYEGTTDSLKLYIHYLRRKLEREPARPALVQTMRGVGYRFGDP